MANIVIMLDRFHRKTPPTIWLNNADTSSQPTEWGKRQFRSFQSALAYVEELRSDPNNTVNQDDFAELSRRATEENRQGKRSVIQSAPRKKAGDQHSENKMQRKPNLTKEALGDEASEFSSRESRHAEPSLYGVTDGKAVGTYLEHKFRAYLKERYSFEEGNSASGIDFPGLSVDMKVTSIKQPQSSCPFKSARQKIYGLGYSLLVFVYDKLDSAASQTTTLTILHTIFVEANRTGDFQTTRGILEILKNEGNKDDLVAFILDKNLPVDEIEASNLAGEILTTPPKQGYLTISNALQWRLQYGRVIERAGQVDGVLRFTK